MCKEKKTVKQQCVEFMPTCSLCNSRDVLRIVRQEFSVETGAWRDVESEQDRFFCSSCEMEVAIHIRPHIVWRQFDLNEIGLPTGTMRALPEDV